MVSTQPRIQNTRQRLKTELERAAREPNRFVRALRSELGPVAPAAAERLRNRVRSGEAWLPRLALASDRSLYSQDVAYFESCHTVAVHEDLVHDERRIAQLYRDAVREQLLPKPSWWDRLLAA